MDTVVTHRPRGGVGLSSFEARQWWASCTRAPLVSHIDTTLLRVRRRRLAWSLASRRACHGCGGWRSATEARPVEGERPVMDNMCAVRVVCVAAIHNELHWGPTTRHRVSPRPPHSSLRSGRHRTKALRKRTTMPEVAV